ncbi:globin domain-containing protein [Pseudonocardia halophobica]|uniref:globin domain-containing protein n=1 Tax=Pseudonocardia halophobica TaxID=29401 RepID=UPI003D94C702
MQPPTTPGTRSTRRPQEQTTHPSTLGNRGRRSSRNRRDRGVHTLDPALLNLLERTRSRIEHETAELTDQFYAALFTRAPGLRTLFPLDSHGRRAPLTDTLIWLLQRLDHPEELARRLADLGRDHRKHGITAAHYETAGNALLEALAHIHGPTWTPPLAAAWTTAYAAATHDLLTAAAADRGPALWLGRVVEHDRPAADLACIVVQTLEPVPHEPGQYLSVEIPQRPGMWRHLSPTEPARPDNVMRFCVRAVRHGLVSPALVAQTRVGDTWRLGPPLGRLPDVLGTGRDLLLLASGTGIAPISALIAALATRDDPPHTHLYVSARSHTELRALLAAALGARPRPWLALTPVIPPTEDERPGSLVGTALRGRTWRHHDVVICGPPRMQKAAADRLLAAGVPANQIHGDPLPTSTAIQPFALRPQKRSHQ